MYLLATKHTKEGNRRLLSESKRKWHSVPAQFASAVYFR